MYPECNQTAKAIGVKDAQGNVSKTTLQSQSAISSYGVDSKDDWVGRANSKPKVVRKVKPTNHYD